MNNKLNRSPADFLRKTFAVISLTIAATTPGFAQPDHSPGLVDLPDVPAGFEVKLFAKDPLVRNPCSMAFDAKGRLFVGMGPQYRSPKPETPRDSVFILTDTDGDGIADTKKIFATGFNCIQGLAWHGRDLWVANSPDLTIVRDLDGDDEADEYVLVYTDLGNIEHAIHGLNWAPDGRLYMSKGNSKGLNQPDHYAPKPFRDIWGMPTPAGAVDFPEPRVFKKGEYKNAYHHPSDDWGRSGGVLRCDDLGKNLEIVSRGFRNPWDMTFDSGFNFIGTDNDQDGGDRVFMPFYGADFGWSHAWSSHWTGEGHLPTAPISAPVFTGSGTGTIFYDATQLPENYRNVFFINDWLHKKTYVYRPVWDGALLQPANGKWEEFIVGTKALFRPTDLEVGPDGALYSLGWGREYGVQWDDKHEMANEGRVFRVASKNAPLVPKSTWYGGKRDKPLAKWTVAELIADLAGPLPVWRVNAQEELVRRSDAVNDELRTALASGKLTQAQETWTAWVLGRISPNDAALDQYFVGNLADSSNASLNLKVQSTRILGRRAVLGGKPASLSTSVASLLKHPEPRLRFEAAQAIWQAKQSQFVTALKDSAATETERLTFYTVWHALRDLTPAKNLRAMLKDSRAGVRRAALLASLDLRALSAAEVTSLAADSDRSTSEVAKLWLTKTASGGEKAAIKGSGLDGSKPVKDSGKKGDKDKNSAATIVLKPLSAPTTVDQALAVLSKGNPARGEQLFLNPGVACFNCHRVGERGNKFGPDLSDIGSGNDPKYLIESMINPNAIIKEGFSGHDVETANGDYFGTLVEETDFILTLAQASGDPVRIEKSKITKHTISHNSPMPAFAEVLSPEHVADLASWLLLQKAAASGAASASPSASTKGEGFAVEQKPDRFVITHGGKPVAHYIWKDENVLRPFFAHLHAPDGVQVTRNFPPIEGKDPTDHAALHPGLWLGFGDISGNDYWRNKSPIKHDRIVEPPVVRNGKLQFATENSVLTKEGKLLCKLTNRATLALRPGGYLLVLDASFKSDDGDFAFGDQEEMGFGIRMATPIIEKNGGTIRNSAGATTAKATWGKPADWCDYSGMMDNRLVGATIFPDPKNFRPSWWHNRDYGVFVANPFGRKAMKQGEISSVEVKKGETFHIRFGALLHSSPLHKPVDLGAAYRDFVAQ